VRKTPFETRLPEPVGDGALREEYTSKFLIKKTTKTEKSLGGDIKLSIDEHKRKI